jgi:hypothetical protein
LNKLLEHGKVLVPKKFEYHCVPVWKDWPSV